MRHPFRSGPHDLERDVAPHGKSGQSEGLRRRIKRARRHIGHAFVAGHIGNDDVRDIRERLNLRLPEPVVTEQARQQ